MSLRWVGVNLTFIYIQHQICGGWSNHYLVVVVFSFVLKLLLFNPPAFCVCIPHFDQIMVVQTSLNYVASVSLT